MKVVKSWVQPVEIFDEYHDVAEEEILEVVEFGEGYAYHQRGDYFIGEDGKVFSTISEAERAVIEGLPATLVA